jgi:hypothetical protein
MSLFGVRSLANLAAPERAASSLDAVTQAAEGQLGEGLRGVFQAGDQLQQNVVDGVFGAAAGAVPGSGTGPAGAPGPGSAGGPGSIGGPELPAPPVRSGSLDTSTFVALGEGLTAGAADFFLSSDLQHDCFPAQMARQMRTGFAQALLQPPGIGNLPGFQPLPVVIPGLMQTTVVETFPPPADLGNLAVPNFRLADAVHLRPQPPLVHRHDARQTAANLILGLPRLLERGSGKFPTQLERALERRPTFALVALGYTEAIEAALAGDPGRLPSAGSLRKDYGRLLKSLREAGAEILVLNVPDPFDTACLSSIEAAAGVVKAAPQVLLDRYGLNGADWITVRGLVEIGYQLLSQEVRPLPEGAVVKGGAASRIRERIRELNGELAGLAREHRASLLDLHALWRSVRSQGVNAGSRQLTAGFLGGFYSLNGYYPGKTGHALIANEALQLLNQTYGAEFPLIDLFGVAATDPVVQYQPAEGPDRSAGPPPAPVATDAGAEAPTAAGGAGQAAAPIAPDLEALDAIVAAAHPGKPDGRTAAVRRPVDTCPPPPLPKPIELPPGLEVVLTLNKERSYFGDALRAVDCLDPQAAQFGACGGVLFGGLAMMDSHLSGRVRLRFSPPVNQFGYTLSQFELSVMDGLQGDDGILAAPQFYKLPGQRQAVADFPGLVSRGLLDLTTGQLAPSPPFPLPEFRFAFSNTALLALINVNPNFPPVPISFPALQSGQPGSAWVQFTQREDGGLDFEFFGTTFVPLQTVLGGAPARFPLPFAGPSGQYASILTRGVALHPHLHLSTREMPAETPEGVPEIPTNTVRELTFLTHNTSFGDAFTLNGPYLGGTGNGRSQLAGRLHVQFGEREGNTVPIYVSAMPPGGFLAPNPESPYWQAFVAQGYTNPQLLTGPLGFNEFLRFPLQTYSLDDVFLLNDPLDLAVGAVDVRTGEVLGGQLNRGFIGQDVFFALLRVEPRTPQDSFQFRGPASLQKGPRGEIVYRFCGEVHIPYPTGFQFPFPNLATSFPAGPDSSLDPFFWIRAVDGDPAPPQFSKRGGQDKVPASNGNIFSYRYDIPADPARRPASFEYENHSQHGSFRLRSLSWVHFANASLGRAGAGEYDVVTFAGYGVWSMNGLDFPETPVTVQISTARSAPYVGIQVNGGATSNVNTKPVNQQEVRP